MSLDCLAKRLDRIFYAVKLENVLIDSLWDRTSTNHEKRNVTKGLAAECIAQGIT